MLNHQNATEIAALLLIVEERDRLLVSLEEADAEKDRLAGECYSCYVVMVLCCCVLVRHRFCCVVLVVSCGRCTPDV